MPSGVDPCKPGSGRLELCCRRFGIVGSVQRLGPWSADHDRRPSAKPAAGGADGSCLLPSCDRMAMGYVRSGVDPRFAVPAGIALLLVGEDLRASSPEGPNWPLRLLLLSYVLPLGLMIWLLKRKTVDEWGKDIGTEGLDD